MYERTYPTPLGDIRYWISDVQPGKPALILLPGLTADHRLFDRQVERFEREYTVLTWDAPGHAASRPFRLTFSLTDKAVWLHDILAREGITRPVLIGQSMGGYVAQAFMQRYPGEAAGFVSIDSAPLQRQYTTAVEIWLLRHIEPVYRLYPWKALCNAGANGCAITPYGRQIMRSMLLDYEKDEYCRLAGHGFRILGDAMAADLPYTIDCPAMLICGEHDQAGSAKGYNRRWAARTGLPLHWIAGAGHNANTDQPEEVNRLIEDFVQQLG